MATNMRRAIGLLSGILLGLVSYRFVRGTWEWGPSAGALGGLPIMLLSLAWTQLTKP